MIEPNRPRSRDSRAWTPSLVPSRVPSRACRADRRPPPAPPTHLSGPSGDSCRRCCENGVMRSHFHTPRDPDRHSVLSSDFAALPSVLTSREAANVLRVGVREVRALVDSGQLPGMRLGPRKVVRISRAAVLALLGVQSAG